MNDVVIVGGGHNGLVCAFYLARAGLKVTVLERRGVLGGAAVTEEFFPGFRNSTASYTVSLLNPKVIADMQLARHGLEVAHRRAANFLPLDDRNYLLLGEGRTRAAVAKFSARDAERLGAYNDRLEAIADVLRELVLKTPPNLEMEGGFAGFAELLKGAALGRSLARLDAHRPARPAGAVLPVGGGLAGRLVRERPDQGRASASTGSWLAPTPAPMRPAPPMCCCIMSSAR